MTYLDTDMRVHFFNIEFFSPPITALYEYTRSNPDHLAFLMVFFFISPNLYFSQKVSGIWTVLQVHELASRMVHPSSTNGLDKR